MCFRRTMKTVIVLAIVMSLIWPAMSGATPLTPFIDLQEKGLTLAGDGTGLFFWGGGPVNLTVDVQGTVRFALLYWAGRQRPDDNPSGTSVCNAPVEPYRDQEMLFDGTAVTGTNIGTECQPVSGGGPIFNIGYFADVTSLVAAKGVGLHTFTFADGNRGSNLWRLDGVSLLVAYTNASDASFYRVLVFDGLDQAYGNDPTPGDPRVTQAITFNHGANLTDRAADLLVFVGDGEPGRPDRIDISNNASVVNGLDGSNGTQWDHDILPINIPAGVGTTTVQAFSEPPGSANPDSLLWEVAALRVQQLDAARAKCPITLNDPGPPARIEVTIQDVGTGLAEILVTKSENADTVVPPFTVGTTTPVVLSATKIDQTKRARVEARVTDLAGNVALCDPILLLIIRDSNTPAVDSHNDVPRAEDKVTVTNGSPGINHLEVIVNGRKFNVTGLKDGEEKTIDISSAMVDGDNTVTFRATGNKGGWANVMIWDGISQ